MTMGPHLRRAVLTAHVVSAVGWIGAVAAYLVLALAAETSAGAETVRAAFIAMELLYFALIPLAALALLTGLVQALGTNWGLFRRYWVLVKFVLTVVAFVVMLNNLEKVSDHAEHVLHSPAADLPGAGHDLLHAGGGLVILLVATILGTYKPGGLTRHGRRRKAKVGAREDDPSSAVRPIESPIS